MNEHPLGLMRAIHIGEVGAVGFVVDVLNEALLVAVIDSVVKGAPFRSPAMSTANCAVTATASSTLAVSTAAVLLPVRFLNVVPALFPVLVLREVVSVVTVNTDVEALYPTGVTLSIYGNSAAHN